MSTAEIVLLVLGAWCVGSVLLGLLIGRLLRAGRRHAQPPPEQNGPNGRGVAPRPRAGRSPEGQ